ncbi:hypothetical protein JNUCC0626_28235 [Lentzea sp. JNUCC 0626]|uniref:hypothetical protein n=1 Tax=Lentzea sp. JNUCC 0626 TaxID=3367513 RepID=UPI003749327D
MEPSALPGLKDWLVDTDPRTYLRANASVSDAAAFSLLFWPAFVEYRGGVFLGLTFEPSGVDLWFDQLSGDVRAVEGVVNHLHLWDAFSPEPGPESAFLSGLARQIAEMWQAALNLRMPGREFVFTVSDDPEDYGPTISFRTA